MAPQAERALRSSEVSFSSSSWLPPPQLLPDAACFSCSVSSQASSNIELLSPKNRVRAGLGPPGAAGVVG